MRKALRIILLIILSLIIAFPLFYLISLSLSSPRDFLTEKALFFPSSPNWSNFSKALSYRYLPQQLLNSIITSTLSALIKTVVITLAAFAFTHLQFKGKKLLLVILCATLFVPQDALLYQNYRTIAQLRLLDTYLAIIAPTLFSASQMLILIGAFSKVDRDYYDTARIDGASDILYITKVLIPLAQSVIITVVLQAFIGCFNSYLWVLLVTNKPRTRTIQIGLTRLGFAQEGNFGAEMASILLVVFPFLILIAIGKKWIEIALTNNTMNR